MFENRRHKLMRIADRLVDNAIANERHTEDGRPNVTPDDVSAWAFGECGFHASLDEATSCLDAAFVKRGYRPTATT